MSADNPYEPPAARVADRQPDTPSILPRVAASLALLFAGGALAVSMLEIARSPAPVRLIEYSGMLGATLAAALVGVGLWRCSPWAWWSGLLGAGMALVHVVLHVQRAGQPALDRGLWLPGVLVVAFLAVLLLPRTIRAFTR